MKYRTFILLAGLVWLMSSTLFARAADEGGSLEYRVKAAIVYHTIQFTEWPASAFGSADAPIVVALVGQDVYGGALQKAIEGRTASNRRLVYRHFADVGSIGACHVLVVSSSEQHHLGLVFSKTAGKLVLTLSDVPNFLPSGGMMRVFIEQNKPHFEIRVKVVENAGLKMSSKLLKLARIYPE